MNRFRIFAALILSAVLLVTAAPALEARPLSKPQISVPAGGGWLSAAWNWLARTLLIEPAPSARQEKAKPDPGTTDTDGGGGARPMAGSCIDPNGCWGG